MRKVLIGILIILLIVATYYSIADGIQIGEIKILSIKEIEQENNKLTVGIQEIQNLMFTDYKSKSDQLDKSITSLLSAKDEYYDLVNVSTEGELSEAHQEETYTYEYLWTKIGRYATIEGVLLKLEFYSGDTGESNVKNISYTVNGHYLAIINFMAAIEDDSKLGFRFENFKLLPNGITEGNRQNLTATFVTKNIRIKAEKTSNVSTPSVQSNNQTTTENTTANTTTTNTTTTQNQAQ